MIEKIEILQHCEGCNLGSHPCEEASRLLCIVAYHHEMVIQLRKDCFNSLSETLVGPCGRCPVLLVQPIRSIKGNVGSLGIMGTVWFYHDKITGTDFDSVPLCTLSIPGIKELSVLVLILFTAYIDIYCGRNQNLSRRVRRKTCMKSVTTARYHRRSRGHLGWAAAHRCLRA